MFLCDKVELQGFFQEIRRPIWQAAGVEKNNDTEKYGRFDYGQFGELELRCYILIRAKLASMWELKNVYTLDEMLKLYALHMMEVDIENGRAAEMSREVDR